MSNYNSLMNLASKASAGMPRATAAGETGYAMAALLVGMAVMAIVLSVAMPTWSHMIRREKEQELVFRGTQYARAINQYQRKFANASPPSLDVLIEQRLLRKKFKDPLSPNKDGEFQMLYLQNQSTIGGPGQSSRGSASFPGGGRMGGSIGPSPTARGAIVGVASKNTGQSILVYKGKDHYDEWHFIGMEMSIQAGPGAGAGGRGGPQRGGRQGGGREGGGREGFMGGPDNRGGFGGSGFGGRGGSGGAGAAGRGTGRGPSPQP
jgi:type II secretory pathway pseudopilin PulG